MFDFLFKKRELLPLPYKRELHCHIVPGVDDGSQSMEDSLTYIKQLHNFGVEKIIFTPHHTVPRFLNTSENIQPIFDELKARMEQEEVGVEAEDYSFEYRVDEGFLKFMETGKWGEPQCQIRPLHGRYLLIESSWRHAIPGFDNVIERLLADGYYLILAHPERYLYYAGQQGRYYHHLQERQVEFQCNILSFAGYYGDMTKKMAYWMLEQGYVNFLGSDLHNIDHCRLIEKFLRSKDYASIHEDLCATVCNDRL